MAAPRALRVALDDLGCAAALLDRHIEGSSALGDLAEQAVRERREALARDLLERAVAAPRQEGEPLAGVELPLPHVECGAQRESAGPRQARRTTTLLDLHGAIEHGAGG